MEPITLAIGALVFTLAVAPLLKKTDNSSESQERIKVLEELNTDEEWCEIGRNILSQLRQNYPNVLQETLEAEKPGYCQHKRLTAKIQAVATSDKALTQLFEQLALITLKLTPLEFQVTNEQFKLVVNQKIILIEGDEYSCLLQGDENQVTQGKGNTPIQENVKSDSSHLREQASPVCQKQRGHRRPPLDLGKCDRNIPLFHYSTSKAQFHSHRAIVFLILKRLRC